MLEHVTATSIILVIVMVGTKVSCYGFLRASSEVVIEQDPNLIAGRGARGELAMYGRF